MSAQVKRLKIPVYYPTDVLVREVHKPESAILLLHGYLHSGEKLLQKVAAALPKDALIIAPNGPYPVPQKTNDGYRVGYSWYFFDPVNKQYLVERDVAVAFVAEVIQELKIAHLPMTIIGYSQGGYIAPFVGFKLKNVKHVIGIACEFIRELQMARIPFRLDAIHGQNDEIVTFQSSQANFNALKSQGLNGSYYVLKNSGHTIDPEIQGCLKQVLEALL